MAIALDTSTDIGGVTATSLTGSHTCTGANLILWVVVRKFVDDVTSVTYNGDAMTQAVKKQGTGSSLGHIYLYYLINPDTGAHDVVVNASTSGFIAAFATSYTGASQTGQPDATSSTSQNGVGSGSNYAQSVTTVADNCWVVGGFHCTGTGTNMAAGANTTERQKRSTTATLAMYDSNGAVTPAGVRTLNASVSSGSQDWWSAIASFAPDTGGGGGGGTSNQNMTLLGVS